MKNRTRRPRGLSDEELALWAEVARTVKRRPGALAVPEAPRVERPAPLVAPVARPPEPPRKSAPPPLAPLERKLKRDLSRGRGVDSALDLHGLNQAEAHHALRGFLSAAQARGDRLVIVVTGKGGKAGSSSWIDEPGVLRRLAPHWLRAPDMRAIVLGFEEAQRHHGGAGALYVRLRRAR